MTTVARLLKERTSSTHRRVEAQLGLLDAGLTAGRLFEVIERLCGFWVGGEAAIDGWAGAHPAEARALQWARRRRAHLLTKELVTLRIGPHRRTVLACAPPVFQHLEHAEVLGWLYVTEGSTLGGAIIDRHVRGLIGTAGPAPRCFTPYSEGPGPMWRSFKAILQSFAAGDCDRTGAVTDAAAVTFEALERWLAPLAIRSPP